MVSRYFTKISTFSPLHCAIFIPEESTLARLAGLQAYTLIAISGSGGNFDNLIDEESLVDFHAALF